MGKYTAESEISRGEAWTDLKEDGPRMAAAFKNIGDGLMEVGHVFTDVWVNGTRLAGVKNRDTSQLIGKSVMWTYLLVQAGWAGWYFV